MMTLGEAARAVGGTLRGADIGFDGVTTDSRALRPGQFFVALRGERFDAHDFVADVLAAGAAGVLVDAPWAAAHPDIGPRTYKVKLGRAAGQDDDDVFALIWNLRGLTGPAFAPPSAGAIARPTS